MIQNMKSFETRFAPTIAKLTAWWNHEDQEFPCIIASVPNSTGDEIPDTDDLAQFWMDLDFRKRRFMHEIENSLYFGQAVPCHYVDFGSSAMACILGARYEFVDKETIWAHPAFASIDEIIDIQINRKNEFYQKVIEATTQSAELAHKHHFVAPYALGGLCDNLAGLYGTENLLMDLALQPGKVKLALENQKHIWIQAFDEIQSVISICQNQGGIGWAGIWSPGTTFPIQEDFSYMISGAMFTEFCLPHIYDIVDILDYPFYHLDGQGSLVHLNALLGIPKLKAIQWQPGAGKEELHQWYDVIKAVLARGKSVQVYAEAAEVEELVNEVGSKGLLIILPNATYEQASRLSEKYGYNYYTF